MPLNAFALLHGPAPRLSTATDSPPIFSRAGGSRDFDFLFGPWRVVNRRLMQRLAASTEWETFAATNVAHPVLGGLGNVDEFRAEQWRPGFIGMTLRLYDPAAGKWSLYWIDNKTGVLQPPVVGAFQNGTGVFEGQDEFKGRPIRVRFIWTHPTENTARWEQAFSPDNGQTWETNWVMDFSREGA
jgi:hypothetical protein